MANGSAERRFSRPGGILKLWAGWLLAPIAWGLHLQISYMLVPWVCATGRNWIMNGVTLAMLLMAAVGIFIAFRCWKQTGGGWPRAEAGVIPRSRFMALGGALSSVLFFIVIITQGIPNFIIGACR